jgi:thymidylate kinase
VKRKLKTRLFISFSQLIDGNLCKINKITFIYLDNNRVVFMLLYFRPKIKQLLLNGDSVVLDRYAFSGVAFSTAKVGHNKDLLNVDIEELAN